MSRHTQLMWGITFITVPTIVFGGLVLLGVVSGGRLGLPAPPDLTLAVGIGMDRAPQPR